ncbi:MAG: DUF6538 domain-containing protein [Pseudomonadota bacterium]
MRDENFYLLNRNGIWYYYRRVPGEMRAVDDRNLFMKSLKTRSAVLARKRRDRLVRADHDYWLARLTIETEDLPKATKARELERVQRRYELSQSRAVLAGIDDAPIDRLLTELAINPQLVANLGSTNRSPDRSPQRGTKPAHQAAPRPDCRISEAFDLYCEVIGTRDTANKARRQKHLWRRMKERSVNELISVIGDIPMDEISRSDAQKFHAWWAKRLEPKIGGKALSANTANRSIGNVRKLYTDYYTYFGDEHRVNPFRKLNFKETTQQSIFPLDDDWVRERILKPGALDGLREDAFFALMVLIETGARITEIAHLTRLDIVFETQVPYIRIRPEQRREMKVTHTKRNIPLVGVALEALKRSPQGFPRFRGRNDLLSAALNKPLRENELFPTTRHQARSFRHSFEQRTLEAGLDYGLRCELMGHSNDRPKYGSGGSMAWRRDQLLKIAHPYDEALFDRSSTIR